VADISHDATFLASLILTYIWALLKVTILSYSNAALLSYIAFGKSSYFLARFVITVSVIK